jgi:hypothetical protein
VPGQAVPLVRLGPSCMDLQTQALATDNIFFLGDTYWEWTQNGIHQLDPFTGKAGREWMVSTGEHGWVVDAGGQIWVNNDPGLTRVDIPLDKMTLTSPPAVLPCTKPTVSPSASATPTPTPTSTPSPSPVPSDSDSPKP